MLLAVRSGAGQQRLGWMWPLFGFIGGSVSYLLVQREDELAKIIAVALLTGWSWLCLQPAVRHKFDVIGGKRINRVAIDRVTQSVQQGLLFFSLPILVVSTQALDYGQVIVLGLVVLAALLSTIDSAYAKFIASRQLPFVTFHCLCTFVASLVVLPIVVPIPMEQSFNVALMLVVLWLVVGAPLNRRHNDISLRKFALALIFPLFAWSMKDHIPPAAILVERSVVTNEIANHEPVVVLSEVSLPQLRNGLYLHATIDAPLGLGEEVIFNWRHDDYSDEIAAATVGDHKDGYRTYALKKNFTPDSLGHWTVDILTSRRQLLDRVEFEVIPGPVYSSAFMVPSASLSMPRVTGFVIKPSM
jgi:hypothetical protein